MAYIKVDISQFPSFKAIAQTSCCNLEAICDSIHQLTMNLDWEVKSSAEVNSMERQIRAQLQEEAACLRKMSNFFEFASEKYGAVNQSEPWTDAGSRIGSSLKEIGKKTVKKAGLAGKAFGIVDSVSGIQKKLDDEDYIGAGGDGAKTGISAWQLGNKALKKYKNMKKAAPLMSKGTALKSWTKSFWGLGNYFDAKKVGAASKGSTMGFRYYNNFQKAWESEIGNVTSVSVIGTAIGRGVENYQEYTSGKITGLRAIVEAAGETATEMTLDLALTAGTAAFLGAAVGTVVVPAIAVGAVVVAEKWFLDVASRAITGDENTDFAETASNAFINLGAKMGELLPAGIRTGVGKAAAKGSAAVSKLKGVCADALGTAKSNITDLIGNIKSGARAVSGIRKLVGQIV